MPTGPRCPRCGSRKFWALNDGRRRCAGCRFDWRPGRWPLRLTPRQWRAILRWFVRGVPSVMIADETGLERKRVLRALTVVRRAMARGGPPGTKEIVKESARVAERLPAGTGRTAGSRAPASPPVIGLYAAQGEGVWAEVVPDDEAEEFRQAVRGRRNPQRIQQSELSRYAALVHREHFYRLGDRASGRFGDLEAFWAYVRHQLRGRGGIRRSRLGLYLAEYSWRYSRRRFTPAKQLRDLVELLRRAPTRWKERDFGDGRAMG